MIDVKEVILSLLYKPQYLQDTEVKKKKKKTQGNWIIMEH